ncbi:Indole-3-acetic acid-amido synthetase GH3.5 [Amphibalanus amphitrite]|uniref:Indole-3-acetic acid-amido synthetase GH3.5 n=2 Tax=Amphibalanus amphitrite TaxID=1232801 RepID=A0A6A4W7J4_AMPAM|nr:Indole-3-acetic acid-amido synthetase GH3.5 [Amphibalanus amphitrite]
MIWLLGSVALLVTAAATLCVLVDFLRRPRSNSLSLRNQLAIYGIQRCVGVFGAYQGRKMERDSRRFMEVQHALISTILRTGERTRYGRDHGLARMRSLSEFRARHPVTEYGHYAAYVQAVEAGEETAMFGDDEVYLFATSSGTTGSSKHLPMGRQQLRRIMRNIAPLMATTQAQYSGGAIAPVLVVTSRVKPSLSTSGKRICSLSPVLQESPLASLQSVTPPCVTEVETEWAACYLGLLFALAEPELHALFTSFIFVFLRLMDVLEEQWPRLLSELAAGRIEDHLSLPEPLLRRINEHLTPAPDRARELEPMFTQGFDRIIPRLWPRLRFLQAARSGLASDMYLTLARRYIGDLPVLDMAYCSSEAWLGISADPSAAEVPFTLTADSCLYEFLPVSHEGEHAQATSNPIPDGSDAGEGPNDSRLRRRGDASSVTRTHNVQEHNKETDDPRRTTTDRGESHDTADGGEDLRHRLLLANELRVGEDYELVVTTRSGLYRYRQGDVVRICRFHNRAPVVQLLYRTGTNLNIHGVNISGLALYSALRAAAERWPGRTLLEFGTAESALDGSRAGLPPHHLMFVELCGPRLTEAEAALLDTCLQSLSEGYALKRKEGAIGAIQLLQMEPGVFLKLRDNMAARGQAHWSQLKRLHILRRAEDVEFLMKHVLPPIE